MNVTRLDDVCEINPRIPKSLADDDVVSFLPMAAVSEEGRIGFEEQREVQEVKKGYTYFERGDVLLAKITPCFENGKAARTAALVNPAGFGSTEFHVLRAGNELDPSYLFYLIWNAKFRDVGARNMTGSAGQKRVPADFLKRIEIPLPPLDEQRRIAAILDKADALRRKRKRALGLLDTFTQSIFLDMFGDPFADISLFARVPFKEVTTRITYGFTQPMSHHDSGIPILTAKNIRNGYIELENVDYAERTEFDALTAKSKPERFDILITKDGAIGRSACLLLDMAVCINQSVALVKPRTDKVEPLYLLHYLMSLPVQNRIEGMKKGNAMPHLQITELAHFPISVPPMAMQRDFVSRINVLDQQRSLYQTSERNFDSTFASLQHSAFCGQL